MRKEVKQEVHSETREGVKAGHRTTPRYSAAEHFIARMVRREEGGKCRAE